MEIKEIEEEAKRRYDFEKVIQIRAKADVKAWYACFIEGATFVNQSQTKEIEQNFINKIKAKVEELEQSREKENFIIDLAHLLKNLEQLKTK